MADSVRAAASEESRRDSIVRSRPGYVIDSILPVEEELRRFRIGLRSSPDRLRGGASSRAELVKAFVRALESSDTLALGRLVLNRAEFAYVIYPGSMYSRPPYRQSPALVWYQLAASGTSGLRRLVDRYGGRPLRVAGFQCDTQPQRDRSTRYWRDCHLETLDARGDTTAQKLFGVIVEHRGRFKFASYANRL